MSLWREGVPCIERGMMATGRIKWKVLSWSLESSCTYNTWEGTEVAPSSPTEAGEIDHESVF